MKNFFSKIFGGIKKVIVKIFNLAHLSPDQEKKIDEIGHKIIDGLEFALPIVQQVSTMAGFTNLGPVFAEIQKWNQATGLALDDPNGNIVGGLKLGLSVTKLREALVKLVQEADKPIQIGTYLLKTVDDVHLIPDSDLRLICETAYNFLKNVPGLKF